MNPRTETRAQCDLTETEAAGRAGISLAAWRRREEDPESVSSKTRASCERVLARASERDRVREKSADALTAAWCDSPNLTPRQAYAIASQCDVWDDLYLGEWLREPREPLLTVPPYESFDLRVLMLVGESRARIGDDDWDALSDGFDDVCRWDEWEVPLFGSHPLLPAILASNHPFRWFDVVEASGPGYMRRLVSDVVGD